MIECTVRRQNDRRLGFEPVVTNFFVPRAIIATHYNQRPPSKTRIKPMLFSCVHKISTRYPSKNGLRPPG